AAVDHERLARDVGVVDQEEERAGDVVGAGGAAGGGDGAPVGVVVGIVGQGAGGDGGAGAQGGGADVGRGELGGEGARHLAEARFGDAVRGQVGEHAHAHHRG